MSPLSRYEIFLEFTKSYNEGKTYKEIEKACEVQIKETQKTSKCELDCILTQLYDKMVVEVMNCRTLPNKLGRSFELKMPFYDGSPYVLIKDIVLAAFKAEGLTSQAEFGWLPVLDSGCFIEGYTFLNVKCT